MICRLQDHRYGTSHRLIIKHEWILWGFPQEITGDTISQLSGAVCPRRTKTWSLFLFLHFWLYPRGNLGPLCAGLVQYAGSRWLLDQGLESVASTGPVCWDEVQQRMCPEGSRRRSAASWLNHGASWCPAQMFDQVSSILPVKISS